MTYVINLNVIFINDLENINFFYMLRFSVKSVKDFINK